MEAKHKRLYSPLMYVATTPEIDFNRIYWDQSTSYLISCTDQQFSDATVGLNDFFLIPR